MWWLERPSWSCTAPTTTSCPLCSDSSFSRLWRSPRRLCGSRERGTTTFRCSSASIWTHSSASYRRSARPPPSWTNDNVRRGCSPVLPVRVPHAAWNVLGPQRGRAALGLRVVRLALGWRSVDQVGRVRQHVRRQLVQVAPLVVHLAQRVLYNHPCGVQDGPRCGWVAHLARHLQRIPDGPLSPIRWRRIPELLAHGVQLGARDRRWAPPGRMQVHIATDARRAPRTGCRRVPLDDKHPMRAWQAPCS